MLVIRGVMKEINFSGKKVLVCGASQGIGRKTAEIFAELGATVILMARNIELLKEVKAELPNGDLHKLYAIDFLNLSSLETTIDQILQETNGIDVLVCNSGGPAAGPLVKADQENFLNGFTQHVLANQLLVKKLSPHMIENKFGRVINIISTSVKVPIPNLGVSNTIRGAVASWSKSLANELGKHNITFNNVLPGYTKTGRLEKLIKASSERQEKTPSQVIQDWKAKVPMARFAEPEEVAQSIVFLASPWASYINGINLPVDGGRTGTL